MTHTEADSASAPQAIEHVDVLIVGAGISGIAGAYHLSTQRPDTSFVILEAMDAFGGTWWTHRYPGIRSDSDLYTFGYRSKPWTGAPIATAEEILKYMGEVIDENSLAPRIRYRHRIVRSSWSSTDNLWIVEAIRSDTNDVITFTTNFLWMCQGYYRHDTGYTPQWPGMERFHGTIVHPQTWPDNLDYSDKEVIVIGSGATAATLVPAIAGRCRHVTMLQRSPTYFWATRNVNELADTLRELDIDPAWIHEIVRRKILKDQHDLTQLCLDYPDIARDELIKGVREFLPDDVVDEHFSPRYRPWQQRVAFVPDGDLFRGIASGQASVVTDEIATFTETGITTASGKDLSADIIVTATGFDLCVLGDIAFTVDGVAVDFSETVTYRGMMFTGVPNLLWVFGYFRASWTLRADLIGDLVCRLLGHMDARGAQRVTPSLRPGDAEMIVGPWIEPDNFNPGYLARSMHRMPKSGDKPEWRHTQDYWAEKDALPAADLDDGCLLYE